MKRVLQLELVLEELTKLAWNDAEGKYEFDIYDIYSDGVIYDTENAEDIPQWVFMLRDLILKEK